MQRDQISYSRTQGGTSNNNPLLALVTLGKSRHSNRRHFVAYAAWCLL
jgi:hypothetical protein